MVVCAVPGAAAATQVSGRELVARALPATADGALDEAAASEVLKELSRYRALAIGPGLGRDPGTQAAVRRIIAEADVPIVVDADALNAIAVDPSVLRARHNAGLPPAVLTPHAGEYERLAGRAVGEDRVAAARELAAQLHAIVLLKGPGTVVAAPDGYAIVNRTGGPALATAGTGDVLTGILGGLIAQGAEPFHAAATGAYVHGRAAAAAPAAPDIVASDLVDALPRTPCTPPTQRQSHHQNPCTAEAIHTCTSRSANRRLRRAGPPRPSRRRSNFWRPTATQRNARSAALLLRGFVRRRGSGRTMAIALACS